MEEGMIRHSHLAINLMLLIAGSWIGNTQTMSTVRPAEEFVERTPHNPSLPTIYIVGDSTAEYHVDAQHEGEAALQGWGVYLQSFLDTHLVNVVNAARSGRSSRTYITEGHWQQVLDHLKPNDIVLIQLGQNDVFPINDATRARGTLPGIGDETQEIENEVTHKHEVVHTYGWYLRQYIRQAQAKGALPIVLSLTPRNLWKDGHVEVGVGEYRAWAHDVTLAEKDASFVDLSDLMATELEALGQKNANGLYHDTVHMRDAGAFIAAKCVVSGLKALLNAPVSRYLNTLGDMVPSQDQLSIRWPKNESLPTLWILGDSTVRNGNGTGVAGMWGWGDEIELLLDPHKIQVGNVAISGRSSRTYYNFEWPLVLPSIRKGDIVLMQFGHNDGSEVHDPKRERGTLPSVGDEIRTIDNAITGKREVVHTYGWYVGRIVADIRSKGATPVICSPIPRNSWSKGKIRRESPVEWSRAAAQQLGVTFVDLNSLIAARYEEWGKDRVTPLYADGFTHTTKEGAVMNAEIVLDELNRVSPDLLKNYLKEK